MSDKDEPPGEVKRDRWGRPLIIPPGGGKPVAYTRATTYAGTIEDTFNLTQWKLRMALIGAAGRPDLVLKINAHRDDKETLNRVVAEAMDAAKAGAAASIGTSLHKLTELVDRGEQLPPIPDEYRRDLDAYAEVMRPLRIIGIERFTVYDELKIGGTHDRTVELDGRRYIADLKTGSIAYGQLKIAMQLAIYSRSELYDITTGTRSPLDVDQNRAIVIHAPAGSGIAALYWVDIATGWDAVDIARQVRALRARSDLFEAFPVVDTLPEQIIAATTREQIEQLWSTSGARWTDEHTALAKAQLADLAAGATA